MTDPRDITTTDTSGRTPSEEGTSLHRIGEYRLVREIGRGGMGVVYEAIQESLGRRVAVKMMRNAAIVDEDAKSRFSREVDVIARLNHPGIVPIFAVGEEQGIPYYAMELIFGASLADILRVLRARGETHPDGATLLRTLHELVGTSIVEPVDFEAVTEIRPAPSSKGATATSTPEMFTGSWEQAVLEITLAAARAIDHAHSRDVVHRDVKPSNLMLTPDGRVILLDFGLAINEDATRVTMSGALLGSLPYMSPEQVRGETHEIGRRSDIYALGVTLYELMTFKSPYLSGTIAATREKILEGRPTSPRRLSSRISWEAETVCLAAMDRDPARRYASAAEFAFDIENVLRHRSIVARRLSPARRAWRWTQRHPQTALSLVFLASIAIGGPTVLAIKERDARKRIETALDEANRQRSLADAARQNAEAALGEANRQRSIADEQRSTAKWAVDRMLMKVGTESLAEMPRMEALRRQLIGDALEMYEKILASSRNEPGYRAAYGQAALDSGRLKVMLGNFETAEADFETARGIFEGLVAEEPSNPEAHRRAANVYMSLTNFMQATNRMDRAARLTEKALASIERAYELRPDADIELDLMAALINRSSYLGLIGQRREAKALLDRARQSGLRRIEAKPDDALGRRQLASIESNLGNIATMAGDIEGAMAAFARATAECDEIARLGDLTTDDRQTLARSLAAHGRALINLDRIDEGLALLERARGVSSQLVKDFPGQRENRHQLAAIQTDIAMGQIGLEDYDGAIDELAEAEVALRRLVAETDRSVDDLDQLAGILMNKGIVHSRRGEHTECEAAYREAVAIWAPIVEKQPEVGSRRKNLAALHHNLGIAAKNRDDFEAALAFFEKAARELLDLARRDPENTTFAEAAMRQHRTWIEELLDAGRHLEVPDLASDIGNDDRLSWRGPFVAALECCAYLRHTAGSNTPAQREAIAEAAVRYLAKAKEKGYGRFPSVLSEESFEILAGRSDFEALRRE